MKQKKIRQGMSRELHECDRCGRKVRWSPLQCWDCKLLADQEVARREHLRLAS